MGVEDEVGEDGKRQKIKFPNLQHTLFNKLFFVMQSTLPLFFATQNCSVGRKTPSSFDATKAQPGGGRGRGGRGRGRI